MVHNCFVATGEAVYPLSLCVSGQLQLVTGFSSGSPLVVSILSASAGLPCNNVSSTVNCYFSAIHHSSRTRFLRTIFARRRQPTEICSSVAVGCVAIFYDVAVIRLK